MIAGGGGASFTTRGLDSRGRHVLGIARKMVLDKYEHKGRGGGVILLKSITCYLLG